MTICSLINLTAFYNMVLRNKRQKSRYILNVGLKAKFVLEKFKKYLTFFPHIIILSFPHIVNTIILGTIVSIYNSINKKSYTKHFLKNNAVQIGKLTPK